MKHLRKPGLCFKNSRIFPSGTVSACLVILKAAGRVILSEPKALLTESSKMPGLDGQKMSKSYGNTISLREPLEQISKRSAQCLPTLRVFGLVIR